MSVYAFIPGYDDVTKENESMASLLSHFNDGRNIVRGNNATRQSFWQIVQTGHPIFVMSHGDKDRVFAQGGKDSAISDMDAIKNLGSILDRRLFIWACRCAHKLGTAFRSQWKLGATGVLCAYPVTVSAPDNQVINDFLRVFSFIIDSFPDIANREDAFIFRDKLQKISEPIYNRLTDLANKPNSYHNLHETATVFRAVYGALEISLANGDIMEALDFPLGRIWDKER